MLTIITLAGAGVFQSGDGALCEPDIVGLTLDGYQVRFGSSFEFWRPQIFKRALPWLLSFQCEDGGWAAFDKDVTKHWLEHMPFADHNAILDPTCSDLTARVLELLGYLGYARELPLVQRAITHLQKTQEDDGSWYGRWGVNYIYGTWQVLRGLRSIGLDMRADWIQRGRDWLESCQKAGINYIRIWMWPQAFGLEWDREDKLHYRMDNAWRLDRVLAEAERRGIFVMLCFDYHGIFEVKPDFWGGNNFWTRHLYNATNGGPCAVQNDFFDKVPVNKIKDFQTKLTEHLTTQHDKVLGELRDKAAFDDSITSQLKTIVGRFAETYA